MAKIGLVFIAGTLLAILAAGSVLIAFLSGATRSIRADASEVAANFSLTFLKTIIAVIILIVFVFMLTGRKLPL